MLAAQNSVLIPALLDSPNLENFIESELCHDWILRVEHTDKVEPAYSCWQQWGQAYFPVKDASAVINNILSCHVTYPGHAIRLHAEKIYPRSQMIYGIYTPDDTTHNTNHSTYVTNNIREKIINISNF